MQLERFAGETRFDERVDVLRVVDDQHALDHAPLPSRASRAAATPSVRPICAVRCELLRSVGTGAFGGGADGVMLSGVAKWHAGSYRAADMFGAVKNRNRRP